MINKSTLVGRLTKDPEIRYTQAGRAVTSFTIASKRPYKDEQGNSPTDFLSAVVWGPQAEFLANKGRKGKMVGVSGRLESRSYDGQDGKKVFVTEINCDEVQLLEWDDNGQQGSQGSYNQGQGSYNQQPGGYNNQGAGYNQQGGNNPGYGSNGPGSRQNAPGPQGGYNGGNNRQNAPGGQQDSPYHYMNNQQPGPNNGQNGFNRNNDPFANVGQPIDIDDSELPF